MVGEVEAGSQRAQLRGITPSLRLWSMLLTLETDSSHSRPHSSCLLRQLPLGGGGEHEEAEGGGGGELRAGGEDVKGEGSSRRHRSSLQRQRLLLDRQPSLSLLPLPL